MWPRAFIELCAPRAASAIAVALAMGLVAGGAQSAGVAVRPKPVDRSGKTVTGRASYYARRDAGRTTASGTPYVPGKLTAASPKLPLGTRAKVTNLDNGKSVNVTVNDRGPYVRKRILDVSSKAAAKLGLKKDGVAEVKVKPLHEPPRPR
jgi:rare lipoprotein A